MSSSALCCLDIDTIVKGQKKKKTELEKTYKALFEHRGNYTLYWTEWTEIKFSQQLGAQVFNIELH
jgi:hypothetical protein